MQTARTMTTSVMMLIHTNYSARTLSRGCNRCMHMLDGASAKSKNLNADVMFVVWLRGRCCCRQRNRDESVEFETSESSSSSSSTVGGCDMTHMQC